MCIELVLSEKKPEVEDVVEMGKIYESSC